MEIGRRELLMRSHDRFRSKKGSAFSTWKASPIFGCCLRYFCTSLSLLCKIALFHGDRNSMNRACRIDLRRQKRPVFLVSQVSKLVFCLKANCGMSYTVLNRIAIRVPKKCKDVNSTFHRGHWRWWHRSRQGLFKFTSHRRRLATCGQQRAVATTSKVDCIFRNIGLRDL